MRAIDEPWQDGDHVGTDDDKEELGGVPAAIWRDMGVRSPRRSRRSPELATAEHFRSAARGHRRSTVARREGWVTEGSASGMEAWELALAMKAPHGSWPG